MREIKRRITEEQRCPFLFFFFCFCWFPTLLVVVLPCTYADALALALSAVCVHRPRAKHILLCSCVQAGTIMYQGLCLYPLIGTLPFPLGILHRRCRRRRVRKRQACSVLFSATVHTTTLLVQSQQRRPGNWQMCAYRLPTPERQYSSRTGRSQTGQTSAILLRRVREECYWSEHGEERGEGGPRLGERESEGQSQNRAKGRKKEREREREGEGDRREQTGNTLSEECVPNGRLIR